MADRTNIGAKHHTNRRMRSNSRNDEYNRRLICSEAARIMADESVHDFHIAKRKAANRLNLPETKNLPTNLEVETALQDYLKLFHGERSAQILRHLRNLAAEAMRFLEKFEPRLVGQALNGTVTPTSEIHLHVCAETPEEIGFALTEANIPFTFSDRRLRFGGDRNETFPAYRFIADTATIELCVFNRSTVRETPLSPIDGKPMRRAYLKEVEELLNEARNTS